MLQRGGFAMKRRQPARSPVGEIDAASAERLIAAASDVAVVLDADGVVEDVVLGNDELASEQVSQWIGRPWADTVTVESRAKIESLLSDAASGASRWRQVNHPSRGGSDWPVLYSTVRVAGSGRGRHGARTIAFGRDLRATEALQLRLIEAQQAMERDYWRFRQAETRYRHLFQASSEAVLIVDAASLRVLEANPAAVALVSNGSGARRLAGSNLTALFENPAARALQAALSAARAARKTEQLRAVLASGGARVSVALSSFRQDDASLLLVRLAPLRAERSASDAPAAESGMLLDFVRGAPDALVFTDPEGRILLANAAFIALAQLGSEEQARGERLDRWLGRTGVELGVLIQNVRQRGVVRLFSTLLRGEDGATTDVEVSASATAQDGHSVLAFAVRDIGRRLSAEPRGAGELPRSAGELAELVGRVPLKDIVGETTDLIEQLCIETALKMTSDNRASAAQMLGLSRQSLYVKLRRHGLGELGESDADG
jgi:transcriptional regulator PpsR